MYNNGMIDMIRPEVDPQLIEQIKKKYPETEKLSNADVIDWALRILINKK